jgi:hypothetical protein
MSAGFFVFLDPWLFDELSLSLRAQGSEDAQKNGCRIRTSLRFFCAAALRFQRLERNPITLDRILRR